MALSRGWSRAVEDEITGWIALCTDKRQLEQIHAHIVVNGQSQNNFLIPKLVRTLAALGNLKHARALTDSVDHPNAFLWTAIIRAYAQQAQSSHSQEALHLYSQMHRHWHHQLIDRNSDNSSLQVAPLAFTLSSVLKACARLSALAQALQVHTHVFKYGFNSEIRIQTAVANLYAGCGRMAEAKSLFHRMPLPKRDIQAWNTMIAGYANLGDMEAALRLFQEMPERNPFTWVEMINGYAKLGHMDYARRLLSLSGDGLVLRPRDAVVIYTAMIAGYAKCGDISAARLVFDEMTESGRDVASWNAMINAYSQAGLFDEAIDLFRLMLKTEGPNPNPTTMATVASACAQLGSPGLAQWITDYLDGHGNKLVNVHTVTAIIDMHAKCGNLGKAYEVFQRYKHKDVICYSSMIAALGIHGRGLEALDIFSQLGRQGLKPDSICFIAVLIACSHAGLVREGCQHFQSMRNDYSILPTADHYVCLVDLLGRAGCMDEAYRIISDKMPPVQPNAAIWGSLLSACRLHSNVSLGEVAARRLLELEPDNSGNYLLLSNLYASAQRWEDVAKVRAHMRSRQIRKLPGYSWIEVDGRNYKFFNGDVWDSELAEMMQVLGWELIDQGYSYNILLEE